jgi:hypothetical protein
MRPRGCRVYSWNRSWSSWGGSLRGGAGRSAGYRALRNGVTRKTNCKSGRDDKAFKHSELSLLNAPSGTFLGLSEPRMNRLKAVRQASTVALRPPRYMGRIG